MQIGEPVTKTLYCNDLRLLPSVNIPPFQTYTNTTVA